MGKRRNNEYYSDSQELKDRKREILGDNYNINNIPKASSFDVKLDKHYIDGKKMTVDEIADTEIVVLDAKITNSKFMNELTGNKKEMLVLQFGIVEEDLETTYVLFTSAAYLIEYIKQFLEQGQEFPFRTVISKHGKTYMFT